MNPIFSFTGARLIVFGKGAFATLPQHMADLGASRPLVIMDGALAKSGLAEKVRALFGEKKIACHLFDGVAESRHLNLPTSAARWHGSIAATVSSVSAAEAPWT